MAFSCVLEKTGNWYAHRMRRGRESYPCCHGPGPPICQASCLFLWGRLCALMFISIVQEATLQCLGHL